MISKQYWAVFGCSGLILSAIAATQFHNPSVSQTLSPGATWQGSFNGAWQKDWQVLSRGQWGIENTAAGSDSRFKSLLRVTYPAGSASPQVARLGAPLGGTQFLATLGRSPKDSRRLRYFLRFSPGFDFVKGGKLPGFYGGTANSGGDIPTGYDGFSSRLMWREQGYGEVYAYLPSSDSYGTSLGRKTWQFRPGVWHEVEQELRLNKPGKANGSIQIWIDKQPVFKAEKLNFRSTTKLKIDGVFFSTFFGGSDRSWATPKTVYIDFAEFSVADI